ncbi:MAG: hypothetical protein LPD71_13635 [Shewanella sp.]|nr:hypothetical protein [Shewanella sp.]
MRAKGQGIVGITPLVSRDTQLAVGENDAQRFMSPVPFTELDVAVYGDSA